MFGKEETNKMKTPVMPDSSLNSQERVAEDEQPIHGRGSPMDHQNVSRRTLLKGGGAVLAGLMVLRVAGPAHALPGDSDEEVIPWLDQPAENPVPDNVGNLLEWEALDSWLTPTDNFFFVNHYGQPDGLDEATWRVSIGGLVARPQSLTLTDLKARPRHEVDFTLECSGNHGVPFAIGAIGNARWAGTRLASLLEEAGVLEQGTEVIFWGADQGTVTIRDNVGILSGGQTGTVEPDTTGGLDLTITEQFARNHPRGTARRRDHLDVRHREPRPAQVGAGQSHASGRPIHHQGRCLGRADCGGGGPNRRWILDPRAARCPPATQEKVAWLCLAALDVRLGDASPGRAHNPVAGVRRRRQHPASARRPLPR
jgi:hypothetical protein